MNQKGLGCFLQCQNCMALPPQPHAVRKLARNKIRGNLPYLHTNKHPKKKKRNTSRAKGSLRINKSVVF